MAATTTNQPICPQVWILASVTRTRFIWIWFQLGQMTTNLPAAAILDLILPMKNLTQMEKKNSHKWTLLSSKITLWRRNLFVSYTFYVFKSFLIFEIIEKDLWESDDFKIIIGVAVIAIFFIIILISCLLYLRVQGEKMSKVERLTQVH